MKLISAAIMFVSTLSTLAFAQVSANPATCGSTLYSVTQPTWLARDIQNHAAWLSKEIKHCGMGPTFLKRWYSFPPDVQMLLNKLSIPHWQIALVPSHPEIQPEIIKQIRFMNQLNGNPAQSRVAQRAEQLLLFGGAAQLPTPGDNKSGKSLGAEGCSAAMAKYILSELKSEFPVELNAMPYALTISQSSTELRRYFLNERRQGTGWVYVTTRSHSQLRSGDVAPGSLMIAEKPGGTHVFGWTRVPSGWGWDQGDKMAVGNTGLAQFGDRMILAQEYLTEAAQSQCDPFHNPHGPINSRCAVYHHGVADLTDSGTNVYAAQGSDFIIISIQ